MERGFRVDNTTVHRWVIEYSPQLKASFRKQHKRQVGGFWRMDKTYFKSKGQWMCLYRVVDKEGNTVDSMFSEKRDNPAARVFFVKAIGSNVIPEKATMDESGANKSIFAQSHWLAA